MNYFKNFWTNTKHVCTYLNAFCKLIPNMVMIFNNFDIFKQNLHIFACRLQQTSLPRGKS